MKYLIIRCLSLALAASVGVATATETDQLAPLQSVIQGLKVESVTLTPVPGISQVRFQGGLTIYLSADGKYFFEGDFYEVGETSVVNLGEKALESERVAELKKVAPGDMIVFAPEKVKASVFVFTDVDCGYCRKLHKEVPQLNRLGIAVKYLAYPRAGMGSPGYRKIASAWCADDPQDALTRLKSGETIPDNICNDNPVQAQFELGMRLGVRGTPALITESGRMLPGYMPAAKLARELGIDPAGS
jgi:thiol:disulfide interchange protein DsbC